MSRRREVKFQAARKWLRDLYLDGSFMSFNGSEDHGVVAADIVDGVIAALRQTPQLKDLNYYDALLLVADLRGEIQERLEAFEREQTDHVIDSISSAMLDEQDNSTVQ